MGPPQPADAGARSTKYPINTNLMPFQGNLDNEVPFGSQHRGGANFVFADGHVAFLPDTINHATYQALGTYREGDTIGSY